MAVSSFICYNLRNFIERKALDQELNPGVPHMTVNDSNLLSLVITSSHGEILMFLADFQKLREPTCDNKKLQI